MADYVITDEYGDKQDEQKEISWSVVRGANVYGSDYFALLDAKDELEIKLYREIPTIWDDSTGEDIKIDIKNIEMQVTEVEDAIDGTDQHKFLLPGEYKLSDLAVSTSEYGYGFQVTGSFQNDSDYYCRRASIGFLALDANGNPYRFAWNVEGSEGSTNYSYAEYTGTVEYSKPGASSEIPAASTRPDHIYDPEENGSQNIDASQIFNIEKIDSVEVLGVSITLDEEKSSSEDGDE